MPSILKPMLHLTACAVRCLSFALLPALTSEARPGSTAPHPSLQRSTNVISRPRLSLPYLALVGSPGIRMESASAELPPEPRPPEPPKPLEIVPAPAPRAVESPPPEPKEEPKTTPPEEPIPQPDPVSESQPEPQYPRGEKPVRILPDDTLRELNPDEVLPFFRYPVNAPEPDRPLTPQNLPPSSATYRLQ